MSKDIVNAISLSNPPLFVVDKITDNEIVLKGAGGKLVHAAPSLFPNGIVKGDELAITIEKIHEYHERVKSTANMILDELLKDS